MKKILFNLLLFFCLFSCEKAALNPGNGGAELPVVEAYLQAGQPPLVTVRRQTPYDSAEPLGLPIEDLSLSIEVDGAVFPLPETAPGVYSADSSWQVEAGKIYRLQFEYGGLAVSATTEIPEAPVNFKASGSSISFDNSGSFPPSFPDPITLTWDNPDNRYFQVFVENIETDPQEIDFGFGGGGAGQAGERPRFSTTPQQTNTHELGFQNFQYLGTHRVVLFRVTAEYVTLATSTQGDAQNLTSPYTNVENGLGIFTGVGADTLFVEVVE